MKGNDTKRALEEAFKQLLQKRPINKITINDIAEKCGISRMTFYYHFKDIYDLADWTVQNSLHTAIGEHRTHDNWQQGFLNMLEVLRDNRQLILNIYHSMDREMIECYMLQETEALLLPVVEEEAVGMEISDQGKHSIAIFYTYALVGVVLDWIRMGMQMSPEQVMTTTSVVIEGDIKNSLKNMQQYEAGKTNEL